MAGGDGFLALALAQVSHGRNRAHVRGAEERRERRGLERIELCQLLAQRDEALLGLALEFGVELVELIRHLPIGQFGNLVLVGRALGDGLAHVHTDVLDELLKRARDRVLLRLC